MEMRINPLQTTERVNACETPAGALEEAIEQLEKLLPKYFIEGGNGRLKLKDDEKCEVEFFYYYDPALRGITTFMNTIWIRVNGNNDVWVNVTITPQGRSRIGLLSLQNLNCPNFHQVPVNAYSLPPAFDNRGIFHEGKRARKRTIEETMQEVIARIKALGSIKA